jgi:hypothetical protein
MSVELEVRLGSATVGVSTFVESVATELRARFSKHEGDTWPALMTGKDLPELLGGEPCAFLLEMAEGASIEVRSYCVGTTEDFGEDGGWWVSLTAVIRSPETFYLMRLAAACLAKLSAQLVLDEASRLGSDRWIEPDKVLDTLGTNESQSFKEAAARLQVSEPT